MVDANPKSAKTFKPSTTICTTNDNPREVRRYTKDVELLSNTDRKLKGRKERVEGERLPFRTATSLAPFVQHYGRHMFKPNMALHLQDMK